MIAIRAWFALNARRGSCCSLALRRAVAGAAAVPSAMCCGNESLVAMCSSWLHATGVWQPVVAGVIVTTYRKN